MGEHFPFVQGVKRGFSADRNLVGEEDLDSDFPAQIRCEKQGDIQKMGPSPRNSRKIGILLLLFAKAKVFRRSSLFGDGL